jgi:CO/xanthine dehydrogenase FAD-binding subunit
MASYARPSRIDDALDALADGRRVIVAGGTDFYPARVGKPLDDAVLDITGLAELRAISDAGDAWRIGALATWTDLLRAELPPWLDGLKLAAREIGGVQIQNAGTIVGNLCNASPAADGIPNLLALDAQIELSAADGGRTVPVADFVQGNRRTARRPNELVTALKLPKPRHPARATFLKLGARKYLVISIVMIGGVIEITADRRVAAARIAIGSCSAAACRLPALEAALAGRPLDAHLSDHVKPGHLDAIAPIDDVRATAEYRRDAALTLVRRTLAELTRQAAP